MPTTANCTAPIVPFFTSPLTLSVSHSAARRSTSSVSGSSRVMSRPAAIWRTTLPQAMVRIPGWKIIPTSSIGLPKPNMSFITTGW